MTPQAPTYGPCPPSAAAQKWFQLSSGQPLSKKVKSLIEPGTDVKVTAEAMGNIPKPPKRQTWEPKLYKVKWALRVWMSVVLMRGE